MGLRDAARDAWVQARSSREDEARAVLGEVLVPFDVGTLDTVDVRVTDAWTRFIFHDPADDVHLAVRLRGQSGAGEVFVAKLVDDAWTRQGDLVESLAHLHEVLPEPEAAIPAWDTQLAVEVGEQYTYDGFTWEVVQAHTTQAGWEPPNTPSLWVKVAG